MKPRPALFALLFGAVVQAQGSPAPVPLPTTPWWDDFPTIIQVPDLRRAQAAQAQAALCGSADDPGCGHPRSARR